MKFVREKILQQFCTAWNPHQRASRCCRSSKTSQMQCAIFLQHSATGAPPPATSGTCNLRRKLTFFRAALLFWLSFCLIADSQISNQRLWRKMLNSRSQLYVHIISAINTDIFYSEISLSLVLKYGIDHHSLQLMIWGEWRWETGLVNFGSC